MKEDTMLDDIPKMLLFPVQITHTEQYLLITAMKNISGSFSREEKKKKKLNTKTQKN